MALLRSFLSGSRCDLQVLMGSFLVELGHGVWCSPVPCSFIVDAIRP